MIKQVMLQGGGVVNFPARRNHTDELNFHLFKLKLAALPQGVLPHDDT